MRAAAFVILVVGTLLLGGCGEDTDREPIPVIEVSIVDQPGMYVVNGKRLDSIATQAELQDLADKHRRPTSGTPRAYVRVYHGARIAYDRVQAVVGWCERTGLDKIQVRQREGEPPAAAPTPIKTGL